MIEKLYKYKKNGYSLMYRTYLPSWCSVCQNKTSYNLISDEDLIIICDECLKKFENIEKYMRVYKLNKIL